MTLAEFSPDGRLTGLFAFLQFYPRLPLPRSFPSSCMLPLPSLPRPLSAPQATVASASHARTCVATLPTTLHPPSPAASLALIPLRLALPRSPYPNSITPSATPTMPVLTFPSPLCQCSSSRWAPGRPSHLPRSPACGLPEAGVEPVNSDTWLIKFVVPASGESRPRTISYLLPAMFSSPSLRQGLGQAKITENGRLLRAAPAACRVRDCVPRSPLP